MVDAIFGDAGRTVVIEERLYGRELSTFAFSDGRTVVPLVPACDYKRARDSDEGPNTGGMGSYSPPPWYDALESSVRRILETTVQAMAQEGRPYRGVPLPRPHDHRRRASRHGVQRRFGDPRPRSFSPPQVRPPRHPLGCRQYPPPRGDRRVERRRLRGRRPHLRPAIPTNTGPATLSPPGQA